MRWRELLVYPDTDLIRVLEKLNETQMSILFVANHEFRVLGSITDGDVRRFFLSNGQIDATAEDVMNKSPAVLPIDMPLVEIQKILVKLNLDAIPLISEKGIVEGVYHPAIIKKDFGDNFVGLLMAGGKGERLLPLTLETPKPLLTVGDRALIDYQIEGLVTSGIKKIYVSVCYLAEKVMSYLGDGSKYGANFSYIIEDRPLGTAGSISMINEEDKNLNLIVCNTDLIHQIDFLELANFHSVNHSDLTLATTTHKVVVPFGVVEGNQKNVRDFIEKPTLDFIVFSGIAVMAPSIHLLIKNVSQFDMNQLILSARNKNYRVMHFLQSSGWIDVGSHESMTKANDAFKLT